MSHRSKKPVEQRCTIHQFNAQLKEIAKSALAVEKMQNKPFKFLKNGVK